MTLCNFSRSYMLWKKIEITGPQTVNLIYNEQKQQQCELYNKYSTLCVTYSKPLRRLSSWVNNQLTNIDARFRRKQIHNSICNVSSL